MDRISGLNANQVAKELQGYKRYKNKTQKEIKEKVGGVSALRDELNRLELKHTKSPKITKSPKKSPKITKSPKIEMNDDILYNIMLNAKYDVLKNLCVTNTKALEYCKSKHFWHDRLTREQLPLITLDSDNWVELYEVLLESYEDAKLMILLTDIEAQDERVEKYDLNGENVINIRFNGSLDDYDYIKDILPGNLIKDMLKKYDDNYDLVPDEIQIYFDERKEFDKYRISFTYEKLKDTEDHDTERTYVNKLEMTKLLTYFIFYSKYAWDNMTFIDENFDRLEYDMSNYSRQLIMKTIKNIQMKNIKI
jgi:hypothetical protein